MSARIAFLCPTCKATMDAPVESAGLKINCLKCGQRLQIPPAERAKTIMAAGLGIREDGATVPMGNEAPLPTAQIAPAPSAPLPPTAAIAPPLTGSAQPTPAVSRSPSQAVGMFFKWIWRDRRFRLFGTVGVGLFACLVCLFCGGGGVRYFVTNGAIQFVRPDITGKWEPANANEGVLMAQAVARLA